MTRLLSYLLFTGLTVGTGLVLVDATKFATAQIDETIAIRCANLNAVTPGTCKMP